jgi:NAD-dependent SIR2 family protein deacetylase
MYLRRLILPSTANFLSQINSLKIVLEKAEAILIGAGAGLSTAAGLVYTGPHFTDNFSDMIERYHFTDMYSAGFYPFKTSEEKWAYWSRFVNINRFEPTALKTYLYLFDLIKEKDYFVLTTNVDHQFQKSHFPKERLFYTQGDYGLFQCSTPCCKKTYDNEKEINEMVREQRNCKIPSNLIPHCPICEAEMSMNLRADDTFVQDDGWYKAARNYENFVNAHKTGKIVFLELGVGYNTPGIIKYNFWKQTHQNHNAIYVCINNSEIKVPKEINEQSICFQCDINIILEALICK